MADEENRESPESPEQKAEEPEATEGAPAEEPPAEEALAEDAATENEEQPGPAGDPDTPGSEAEDVSGSGSVDQEAQPAESPDAATGPEEAVAAEDQQPDPAERPDVPGRIRPAGGSPVADAPSEEASGSDSESDPEVALAADAAAEGKEKEPAKGSDLPPGADLEPIAVEPDAKLSTEEKARLEAEEEERASREAELDTEGTEEDPASPAPAQMESGSRYVATGKRKRSIARVTLSPGEGRIEINKRTLEEYFPRPLHQTMARQPLASAGYEGTVDVRVRVHGGGISGQAGAVRHGIARALTEIDPELRGDLKRRGFLTRDARVKERRKAGLKKARKKPQFSKR
jgi:small subunit ribosomal protein S9